MVGVAAILIVIMAGIFAVRRYNSPEQQVLRAVDAGDYTLALTTLSRNKMLAQNDFLVDKINERILMLQAAYEKETMEYETVCAELEAIEQLRIQNTVKQMEDSRQAIYELYCERNLETFYLCTSQVSVTVGSSQITTTWDYDEQGRLTGYSSSTEYFDSDMTDYAIFYSYVYDDSGKIEKAVLGSNEDNYTLFASYINDLLMEYTSEIDGEMGTLRFKYDENENMTSVEVLDSDGYADEITTMSYYSSGMLREIQDNIGSFIRIKKYNENGKQSEMSLQYGNGEYAYRYVYDYNEQGKMTYQAVYYENDTEPSTIIRFEYDEEGRLTAMGGESSDGNSYYTQGEWDESNQKVSFAVIEGSDEGTIIQEYDEFGNCVCSSTYDNGELQSQVTYTYIILQLPPDYEKPDINDPQYLLSLGGLI